MPALWRLPEPTMTNPRIPLRTRHGRVRAWALIDENDARLARSSWCLRKNGYAARRKGRSFVYLHREVLGLGPYAEQPVQVDHINRDRLDNRRENLRIVPALVNSRNLSSHSDSISTYRGVSRNAGKWVAQAYGTVGGVLANHYLGRYEDELDAAAVAAQWRHRHMPGSVEDPALLSHRVVLPPLKALVELRRDEAMAVAA